MTWKRFVVMLVAAVALSACGGYGSNSNDNGISGNSGNAAEQPQPESAERADGEPVVVAGSAFGDILVDAEGRTLYLFQSDTNGTSACVDDCEATWPPLTGDVAPGDGLDASQLGSTQRADGSIQATYAGHPLYYFAGDQAEGDTNGQGVGDVWFVVGPDGSAITEASAETADSADNADQGDSSGYDY